MSGEISYSKYTGYRSSVQRNTSNASSFHRSMKSSVMVAVTVRSVPSIRKYRPAFE